MPKVACSEEEKRNVRKKLIETGLALMATQGIQHTTVEQIYKEVGISKTFFYSFFPTKEDLVVETLYLQQPLIIDYARSLMKDPKLSWREGVQQLLYTCCHREKKGIAVLTVEEQQLIFRRLSKESYQQFRKRQMLLFKNILESFSIQADQEKINLFINLSLSVMVICRAIPETLPLMVPEAAEETIAFQISAIVDCLEKMKNK